MSPLIEYYSGMGVRDKATNLAQILHGWWWGIRPGTVIEEDDGTRWLYTGRCPDCSKFGMYMRINKANIPLDEPIADLIEGKVVGHLYPWDLRVFKHYNPPKVELRQ